GHLHELLLAWDYGPLGAAVGPLVLDGLMVVSGFALLAMSRPREDTARAETRVSATDSVKVAATDSDASDSRATGAGGVDD
ncbi:MAG TPA: hypothetical protein VHH34_08045, partial [Pseudonocardiaceae bacterium]|nr:hypothetical protein [Pseudonocardiaceae bacterium]